VFGAETVWNASRVPELAAPELQGRLQAITTMVLAVGLGLGALWAGPALDAFGTRGLLGGAALVTAASLVELLRRGASTPAAARAARVRRRARPEAP